MAIIVTPSYIMPQKSSPTPWVFVGSLRLSIRAGVCGGELESFERPKKPNAVSNALY